MKIKKPLFVKSGFSLEKSVYFVSTAALGVFTFLIRKSLR